jgi:endogenous inhibitor of DNA gyrase (YacG/DUF329 family)
VKYRCPTCRTLFRPGPDHPFLPFCSERCKLIDLSGIPDGDDKTH